MKKILFIVLFLSFALFLISLSVFPLEDSDIWFHIKAGEWMWKHKALASPDPFSYAVPNLSWTNLEWGIDLVLAGIEKLAGLNAIIISKAILITVTFLLLYIYQMKLSGSRIPFGLAVLTFGVIASADRFMERVEHIGYFFLVLELGILFLWKTRMEANAAFGLKRIKANELMVNKSLLIRSFALIRTYSLLFALPIIFLLWANMHPSVVLGALLLFLFIIGEFGAWVLFTITGRISVIKNRNSRWKRSVYRISLLVKKIISQDILPLRQIILLFGIFILSVGARLINPYGKAPYDVIISLGGSGGGGSDSGNIYLATLIEYQSPFARGQRDTIYVQAFLWTMALYWLTFIIGSIKNGIRLSSLALLSFITYLSFTAVRQINIFVIVGFLPAMGSLGTYRLSPINSRLTLILKDRRKSVINQWKSVFNTGTLYNFLLIIGSLGLISATVYIIRNGYQLGRVYRTFTLGQRPIYADRALKFLDENKIYGNMFNAYGMGGYLIYGGYPKRKVFIDGRAHYPSDFFSEHGSTATSSAQAKKVMDKYKIDYVINQHPETDSKVLADHLSDNRADWALIYWDQYYLVYVRRRPNRCLGDIPDVQSYSTPSVEDCKNWSDVVAKNEYTYGDPVLLRRPEKLAELSRQGKDALKPKVRTAGELNRNLETNPDNNRARIMLGGIFELIPDLTEAQKVYEEAVRRDPKFAMGHFLLGNILLRQVQEGIKNGLPDVQSYSTPSVERAKEEFLTSFKLDPTVGSPLVTLGIIAQQEGNLDQAIKYLTKATIVAPTDGAAFYRLGILYSNERFDREKAKFYLTKFMALTDESDQRRERVKVILSRL